MYFHDRELATYYSQLPHYTNLPPTYLVLRIAHSPTANALWPSALAKLTRWITQYLVHYERMANGQPDRRVCDELGRRFVLEVIDVVELPGLPDDLAGGRATHEHVRALDAVFEEWVVRCCGGGGEGGDATAAAVETAARFQRRYNPQFCDFLVVDEGALRSLAKLPEETPSVELVGLRERLVSF
jgi:hypothetical protein